MVVSEVILVDENDKHIGTEEKLKAHQSGKLHRAFSVFIFNSKKELLLQKRSLSKYHSPGLWTNTCCSHPRPKMDLKKEASDRLEKEMGIKGDIEEIFSFIYRAEFENGLVEHEYDHVFIGYSDAAPKPLNSEVSEYKWISLSNLKKNITNSPKKYSYWLRACIDKVAGYVR